MNLLGKEIQGRGGRVFRRSLLALVLLVIRHSSIVNAADVQISAALDRDQIALNEQVNLSVTVSGAGGNLPAPQMPGLPDFQVVDTGRAQNFTWVNGQASGSVTYNYALTPLKEGTFSIPPIHLENSAAQTQALTLHVVKGDAAAIPAASGGGGSTEPPASTRSSRGSNALFIRGSVDKSSVYVGQPVVYTFRLYNRVPLFSRPTYQPPQTSGFWSEDLPQSPPAQASVNGLPYNVTELRTVLFPTSAGTAHIGPAQLAVTIENLGSDPFSQDFFAQFFGRAEQKTLQTEPISVHVKPLPDPKPAGFDGAVGHFSISANVDKPAPTVGEAVTLTVTVKGDGNIKSLPMLHFPEIPNVRMFDATAATNIDKKAGRVEGSKVFKTVMIPMASGEARIPSIPFVYFDPEKKDYETLASRAFTLHVKPGAPGSAMATSPVSSAVPSESAAPSQIQRLTEDIRYIRTAPRLIPQGPFWIERPLFWIFHGILFFAVLLVALVRFYQKQFLANSAWNRFKNAADRANAQARKAETLADKGQLKEAAVLLSDAYQKYLADKLMLSPSGLALRYVQEALRQKGVHMHDGEKVRNLWETLDLFEFAPTQIRVEEIRQALATFRHIVQEMEREISWK